jgi:ribonuclease HI
MYQKNPSKLLLVGGIIRNDQVLYLGCFALVVELCDAMTTIELAASKGIWNVWLGSDSQLVLQAFKANTIIPWKLSNRWYNCRHITRKYEIVCLTYLQRRKRLC